MNVFVCETVCVCMMWMPLDESILLEMVLVSDSVGEGEGESLL